MATFIDLDSSYRDRQQYPNPANYTVKDDQMSSWFTQGRTVRAFPQEIPKRQLEFVASLKLIHFVLPYSTALSGMPIIFVDIHTQRYKDRSLISTISNMHPSIKFVCEFDKYQVDSTGNPVWIHYKTNMNQVMRFSRKSALTFTVILLDGSVLFIQDNLPPLDPNASVQVHATFEVLPYIRDDEYSNHLTDFIN